MPVLPITLQLAQRRCLVLGEGDIADAKARLVSGLGGTVFRAADLQGVPATMAAGDIAFIVAAPGPELDAAVHQLRAVGLLINVADQPDLCDFLLPAFVTRGAVMVAISTAGASAMVARQLRTAIDALLPQSLGARVDGIASARPAVADVLTTPVLRRRFWDQASSPGNWADPLSDGPVPDVPEVVAQALSAVAATQRTLALITALSRNPDDMSLTGLRWLQRADLVITIGDTGGLALLVPRMRRDATLLQMNSWDAAALEAALADPGLAQVVVLARQSLPRFELAGWQTQQLQGGSQA